MQTKKHYENINKRVLITKIDTTYLGTPNKVSTEPSVLKYV